MASQELRRHKSRSIDQTPPEKIKVQGGNFRCEIHKLSSSIGIRRNGLSSRRGRTL